MPQPVLSIVKLKIEKGIPLPSKREIYPLKQMKIGDSFFIPFSAVTGGKRGHKNVYSSIHASASSIGARVAVRKMEDGFRVWMMKKPAKS